MKKADALSREEKLLLLLQMFIERLTKSGFAQDKIIRYIWLFCVGYYIKYYLPQSTTDHANRFTIISMFSNALKSSSPRIILKLGFDNDIYYFFRILIFYVLDNDEDAEELYHQERVKYERKMLELGLTLINSKIKNN